MAHFAELDQSNIVLRVIVFDGDGIEGEKACGEFVAWAEGGEPGVWLQTSYNNNFRGKFAGIGYSYDSVADAFVAPEPEEVES